MNLKDNPLQPVVFSLRSKTCLAVVANIIMFMYSVMTKVVDLMYVENADTA